MQFMRRRLFLSSDGLAGRQWCLILTVLMQIMLCLSMKAASGPDVPQRPAIMGDSIKVLRSANGHIDTAATILRLKTANIKTYFYLIGFANAEIDWNDFIGTTGFMAAAQSAGIDVYVYLTPPSEGGPPAPYNTMGTSQDYVNWADAIGTVAQSYSRLKGIVIDDFTDNTAYFTPVVVDAVMAAAHANCARLSFHVIAYFFLENHSVDAIPDRLLFDYADHIDGVIFPYRDLDSANNLNNEISRIAEKINDPAGYYKGYYSISFPGSTRSYPGKYGKISQAITWTAAQSEYKISFYHFGGNVRAYTTKNSYIKKVKINNTEIWSADIADDVNPQYGKVELDIAQYLSGTSATLSFELYEQGDVWNYPVSFNLKNLTGTNVTVHDFSETSQWSFTTNGAFAEGYIGDVTPAHGVKKLPLTVMIYAMGTSWNGYATPTAEYITQALDIAGKAVAPGNVNGFVTYCLLNNAAASAQYLTAKAEFFNYRDLFYQAGAWMFDDGSGNTALDSSIFLNNGTLNNAAWDSGDSIFGSSLSFSGASNSKVNVPNDASLQLTEDLTLSMWIKPGSLSARKSILDKQYYGEFALTSETDGRLSYYHGSSTSNYYGAFVLPANTITTGAWQHIVVTRNAATRTIKSYFNGTPNASSFTYLTYKLPTASSSNVLIGNGYSGGFAGKIDQPVIYSRALSNGEIFRQYLDRYCCGSWSFDENFGATALDNSSYANDGTLSNATWDSSDSKSGSALSFNRTNNSKVTVPNSTSLQLTGDLTLSIWINPSNFTYRLNLLDKRYYGEFALTLFENSGSLLYFHHADGSPNYFTFTAFDTGTITTTGGWQHIVITRNAATRTVTSYYNGTLKKTATYLITQLPTSSTDPIKIGNGYAGGFTGKIDEVKIYNKALSGSEVTALYNSYQ